MHTHNQGASRGALKECARHFGFNAGLLRSFCALYRGPRRVRWLAATSRSILPSGTVVSGCSGAAGFVGLLTLCVLKEVAVQALVCRSVNVVDDIKLHAVGDVR